MIVIALIEVKNLIFEHYGGREKLFDNVSFSIDTNHKIGLIGRNGRGKTTLLNLFMKKFDYIGKIDCNLEFEYFPYEVENKQDITLNIIKNISQIEEHNIWIIYKEMNLLELKEDVLNRKFITLSEGERLKVLILSMFIKENTFLLIDEPTNHLDYYGREVVSNYLSKKRGFILISHDREFLDKVIDHVMSINKSSIHIQKGNYTSWQLNKFYQDSFEQRKNEKLSNEIDDLKNSISMVKGFSNKTEKSKKGKDVIDRGFIGHKSAKLMKRAKNIEKRQNRAIEEKAIILKDIEIDYELMVNCEKYYKDLLLEIKNLSIFYGNSKVVDNLSLEINNGDIVHFCGKNGSGKSSAIKLILGENINFVGDVNLGKEVKISYVSQDLSHLKGSMKEYILKNVEDETIFRQNLHKLGFDPLFFYRKLESYSMGEKKKVLIAKSLSEKANLYIWDEPLNGVDVNSRIQLEKMIVKTDMTMILIEHDIKFVETVSTNKISFDRG